MTTRMTAPTLFNETQIVEIADALTSDGFIVLPGFVPIAQIDAWRARAQTLHDTHAMHHAQIGRTQSLQSAPAIRNDTIAWIEAPFTHAEDAAANETVFSLMQALNRSLFLNLDHAELHYAHYAPGGFYRKHLDRHATSEARVISFIVYLNDTWQTQWGGQLKLYDAHDQLIRSVEPEGGTLVLFLSERFPHEVVPATRTRMSLTGWLRRRH
jgi:SM-20-related protein